MRDSVGRSKDFSKNSQIKMSRRSVEATGYGLSSLIPSLRTPAIHLSEFVRAEGIRDVFPRGSHSVRQLPGPLRLLVVQPSLPIIVEIVRSRSELFPPDFFEESRKRILPLIVYN